MTMRFGAQLWSQHTTWPEFRETALAAEAAGWDSVWTWDHLNAIFGPWEQPILRGLDDPVRPRRGDVPRPARPDGRGEHVPQPGADREARDDPRPRQRRPGRPRHRRRLVRAGARGVRLRDLGVRVRRAAGPARRVGHAPPPPPRRRADRASRGSLLHVPRRALRAATGPGSPADPDRRLGTAEDPPDHGPLRRRLEHLGNRSTRCGTSSPRSMGTARPSVATGARSS